MAKPSKQVFEASPDRTYAALVAAVTDLGYSVKHTDSVARTVSFDTPMSWSSYAGQAMTATVTSVGDGRSNITAGGVRRRRQFGAPMQAYDWGEKGKLARRLFVRVAELLPDTPERGDGHRAATPSLSAGDLAKLVELHAAGGLSDDEFAAAKAKLLC